MQTRTGTLRLYISIFLAEHALGAYALGIGICFRHMLSLARAYMLLCTAERAAVTPPVQISDSSYEATERTPAACHAMTGQSSEFL